MGNRHLLAVLSALLLISGLFAQPITGSGSDWQYANAFNVVDGGYDGGSGIWIPSWYTTDYRAVTSFTPATPGAYADRPNFQRRTAFKRDPLAWETNEVWIEPNHDQVVTRFDLLSGTDDIWLEGVKVTIWGNSDFDPNEDLSPLFPDSARTLYQIQDTVKDYYTGIQFYIEKGAAAGSDVDSLDQIDIAGHVEQLLMQRDTVQWGTPDDTTFQEPRFLWGDSTTWATTTMGHVAPGVGWRAWRATLYFEDPIRIPYEGEFDPSVYGLPFYRIWMLLQPTGCHRCSTGHLGDMVEGLSNRDSFYVEIMDRNDLIMYRNLGVNPTTGHDIINRVDMASGYDFTRWNWATPDPSDASRWAKSELLIGGDTIPPFITDLVPRNEVVTNGDISDQLCSEEGEEIWTADSCQPISFVAMDRSTCIDSVIVEIRYINDGIPSYFPARIDSICFRSDLHFAPEDTNGGPGDPWRVRVRSYGGSWSSWYLVNESGEGTEFEVLQGNHWNHRCGQDTFFIDVGNDVDGGVADGVNLLDPFIDGAHVQVSVEVYNRNYNINTDHHMFPRYYDAYQDTVWDFYIDLSGPNAEIVTPGTTDDNDTEEFYGGAPGWRQDLIEGENIDWRWIADSLPLVIVEVYDDYDRVHDWRHHGDPAPFWTGAEGGSGFNERDFEFTFTLRRLVCDPSYYYIEETFTVTESDLNRGCWFDEDDNGEAGLLYIDFESLFTYRTDLTTTVVDGSYILPFRSSDVLVLEMTELFDDPDYGQGCQRVDAFGAYHTGTSDLIMSGSYGVADAPDGNYGCRNRDVLVDGDSHTPLDDDVPGVVGYGSATARPDTLAWIRIDLEGPVAPPQFFYPADGWVTSDTFQVITVDIYDEIGCEYIDTFYNGSVDVRDDYVAGVYGASADSDLDSRLAINLKVRSCSGDWHPDYVDSPARPENGRTWWVPGWTANCATDPHRIEKINNRWGTRLTFAPRQHEPFRSGDKVTVTVYAWDNAVTDLYDTMYTNDLLCSDGTVGATVTNYIPNHNEGVDRWDVDWLYRTHAEIARFNFFVDVTPPQFVEANLYPICDDTLTFLIRDYSSVLGPYHCDEWCAGIGAADVRIWIYDDEGVMSDFVFFNDLVPGTPTGAVQVDTTTEMIDPEKPCDRRNRYIYARMDFGPDPAREGVIKVWKNSGTPGEPGSADPNSCHFFEPDDSVVIEIWAGDNPNVPWYAATQRPYAEAGYHANMSHTTTGVQQWWWHYYNPIAPLLTGDRYWMSPCAAWRRGTRDYTDQNHTEDGLAWVDTFYYNYENPNWEMIYEKNDWIIQSEILMDYVRWFNDSAWGTFNASGFGTSDFFSYGNDLAGIYEDGFEVLDTSDATELSEFAAYDPHVDHWARDLQWISGFVWTCTDSLIYEDWYGSWPHEDTLTGKAPYVHLELFDAEGTLVWEWDDFYNGDGTTCCLHYMPYRVGCQDGGTFFVGPMYQLHEWLNTPRDTFHTMADIHPDYMATYPGEWHAYEIASVETVSTDPIVLDSSIVVYGYVHGDSLAITYGIHSRNPNQFCDTTIYEWTDPDVVDYHEYRWYYLIDMQGPNGEFQPLEGTRGYAEVDCEMMHVDNNQVRIRLHDVNDPDVGVSTGGTADEWDGQWPVPVIKPGTDLVQYMWGTGPAEDASLTWMPGTHYIYANEAHVVTNCHEEDHVAKIMGIPSVTLYYGLDSEDLPEETTFTEDTIMIADSLYAETIICDKLGNETYLKSNNLGLDNGLPELKGFAFATYHPETDDAEAYFDNWDPDYTLLPWTVPDQESLVGIYSFGSVCTVYVRLWFNDNMDMREIDTHTGHIVRFQPAGWTHWFPIIPMETHGHMYDLASRYTDYAYRSVEGREEESSVITEETDIEPGWNTDREWIGYMVIAGSGLMDGVAKLRVQGFDDNAGNTMLAQEYTFRIESQYEEPCMYWPEIDMYDTADEDELVLTGYDMDDVFCSFEPHSDCFPVTADCFDRTITDSVGFDFWWSTEEMMDLVDHTDTTFDSTGAIVAIDTTFRDPEFRYVIDDMESSDDVWPDPDGEHWWAQTPCDIIDILHQYADGGLLTDIGDNDIYVTIRFRGYSRFYPAHYVEATTMNVLIDNTDNPQDLTTTPDGDIPAGYDLHVIPSVTSETRICITGTDTDEIDYALMTLTNMVSDVMTPLSDTIGPDYDDDYTAVGTVETDWIWYNATDDIICFDWNTPDGIEPGLYRLCVYGYDEINIVAGYDAVSGITEYHTYSHNFCFCRDSIFVPSEAFVARGEDISDAFMSVCDNYPDEGYCSDIYPWADEWTPDWPGWTNIDEPIVAGYDHFNRFQITTYTNPDYSELDHDPLMHEYLETGGYPGDSLYILFPVGGSYAADIHIEDEFGGNISGSNLEVFHSMDTSTATATDSRIETYRSSDYYCYNWIVDDQDNRYDGPVRITWTTYEENYAGDIVETDHVTFMILDTYDPEYIVTMTREGSLLRTCVSDDYPREELWVTNATTARIDIEWLQTIFDQDDTDPTAYVDYDYAAEGRIWEHLRLTIDGLPHYDDLDDANDANQARLWQRSITSLDGITPFWLEGSSTDYGDDNYYYDWTVSNDLDAQGVAKILVKGRDVAGNILTYDEAEVSDAYGKFVLIDVVAPEVEAELITITAREFEAEEGAFDDNFLGEGFVDPVSGSYVYVEIYDLDGVTMLGGPFWVEEDGSVESGLVTLTAGDTVTVCAYDLAGNRTCVDVEVVPHEECCVYELCAGYNMIAVSVNPTNPGDLVAGELFDGLDVFRLVGGTYIPVDATDTLNTDEGYLVMADVPTTVSICGDPVESFEVTGLTAGWNLIGGPWTTEFTTEAGVYPAGSIDLTNVFYYDCAAGSYVPTSEFAHCRGHLMMVTSTDTVTVMLPDTVTFKVIHTEKPFSGSSDWEGALNVEMNNDSKTLSFGIANGASRGFEAGLDVAPLPALPYTEDAFVDNHYTTSIVNRGNVVEWTLTLTDDARVTFDSESVPSDWNVTLEGVDLRAGAIDLESGVYKLTAEVTSVPVAYALDQNTPNPFNPKTDISFSVPEDAHVTLEVFNVLGECVKTLVDANMTAGSHTATWIGNDEDGEQVSSGVYFYKMTAGEYSATKKMTLVR